MAHWCCPGSTPISTTRRGRSSPAARPRPCTVIRSLPCRRCWRGSASSALARWNVPVDDSGGDALSDTPAGVFARLAAEAALDGLPPVTLLALLKHPLCRLDAAAVSTLERAILRGPRPKRGTAGLAHALQ